MEQLAVGEPEPAGVARWQRCPACGETLSSVYVAFPTMEWRECAGCQTVYKSREDPSQRPLDLYEKNYFHGRRSGRDKRFEHRVRKAKRQIHDALEHVDAASLLDVGCSLGYVIEAGNRLKLRSAGTDVSEYAVKVCRDRGLTAEVGTLEKLPFPPASFDIVTLKHVLEHTSTPSASLAELRRVLRPHGVILVAVPDLDYWKGRQLRSKYRYFRPDDLGMQHYVYYTQNSLTRLLERNGFRVVASSKAHFRSRSASRSVWARIGEACRFVPLTLWQYIARNLKLRRELYVIARLEEASPN